VPPTSETLRPRTTRLSVYAAVKADRVPVPIGPRAAATPHWPDNAFNPFPCSLELARTRPAWLGSRLSSGPNSGLRWVGWTAAGERAIAKLSFLWNLEDTWDSTDALNLQVP
jgi:hypothetical protein